MIRHRAHQGARTAHRVSCRSGSTPCHGNLPATRCSARASHPPSSCTGAPYYEPPILKHDIAKYRIQLCQPGKAKRELHPTARRQKTGDCASISGLPTLILSNQIVLNAWSQRYAFLTSPISPPRRSDQGAAQSPSALPHPGSRPYSLG